MKAKIIATTLLLAMTACASGTKQIEASDSKPPYYRVFRGVQLGSLSKQEFHKKVEEVFIPALPDMHGDDGLLAYLPAIPPTKMPAGFPDEVALVAWESEELYRRVRATEEGQKYSAMHWDAFDQSKTKSGGPVPFVGKIEADVPYDVLSLPVDWQRGHSTFFIGLRKGEAAAFLPWLSKHVSDVKSAFSGSGLKGYILVATPEWEIAWMNWESERAMDSAMASVEGKRIIQDATKWMKTAQWGAAQPFSGKVKPATAYNVTFDPKR